MNVRDILNRCDAEACVAFYNNFYSPMITVKEYRDQLLVFGKAVVVRGPHMLVYSKGWGVSGYGILNAEDYGVMEHLIGQPTEFSLSLTPWGEILGMDIAPQSRDMPEHELAAHIFDEMIFNGWSEEDRIDRTDQILDGVEQAQRDIGL